MDTYEIIQITSETYHKCSSIWNMEKQPHTKKWLDEIKSGNRIPYAYVQQNTFLGEGALILANDDPQYTIPQKRVYLSRLIVKKGYRKKGIGTILVDYLCEKAKQLGFSEISVGVDQDNHAALRTGQ